MKIPDWLKEPKMIVALNLIAITASLLHIVLSLISSIFLGAEIFWLVNKVVRELTITNYADTAVELQVACIKRSLPYLVGAIALTAILLLTTIAMKRGFLPLFH